MSRSSTATTSRTPGIKANQRNGSIGWALTVLEESEEIENKEMDMVMLDWQDSCKGCAVIDCGATENVGGVETVEAQVERLEAQGFNMAEELMVDRERRRTFRYGNDQVGESLGLVSFPAGVCGKEMEMSFHMVDGGVPFLLSVTFLEDMEATINFKTGQAIFGALSDQVIQLRRAPSGHWLLPLEAFQGNQALLQQMQEAAADTGRGGLASLQRLGKTEG